MSPGCVVWQEMDVGNSLSPLEPWLKHGLMGHCCLSGFVGVCAMNWGSSAGSQLVMLLQGLGKSVLAGCKLCIPVGWGLRRPQALL